MLTFKYNAAIFFDAIRPHFPGGKLTPAQVNGMDVMLANLPPEFHIKKAAYCFATAYHETGAAMHPVIETQGRAEWPGPTVDEAIARLDRAKAAGKLPQVKTIYWRKDQDGKSWLGRGDVQISHKANYAKLGKRLGIDLVGNPDLALDPDVAADILFVGMDEGLFTGAKLGTYFDGDKADAKGARAVVNGTDRAADIAGYYRWFLDALLAAQVKDGGAPAPGDEPVNDVARCLCCGQPLAIAA